MTISGSYEIYRSAILEKLWCDRKGRSLGFCSVADFSYDTAAYCARYCMKKFSNKDDSKVADFYQGRKPEFCTMSRNPGLGFEWLKKYNTNVYPHGFVVSSNGKKLKPPAYYDNIFDVDYDGSVINQIKVKRAKSFNEEENTPARLHARAVCKKLAMRNLKRSYEL